MGELVDADRDLPVGRQVLADHDPSRLGVAVAVASRRGDGNRVAQLAGERVEAGAQVLVAVAADRRDRRVQ